MEGKGQTIFQNCQNLLATSSCRCSYSAALDWDRNSMEIPE